MKYVNYMDLNLFQIRLFISLSRTLSFTRTAEECMVSQSSVSKSIKALERTLGMQLFVRERGRVRLTPAGRSLADDLSDFYEHLTGSVGRAFEASEGGARRFVVHVAEQHYYGGQFMNELASYSKAHPSLQVEVREGFGTKVLDDLSSGLVDVAIAAFSSMIDLSSFPGLSRRVLSRTPLYAYMLQGCPLAELDKLVPKDLEGYNVVTYDASMSGGDIAQRRFSEIAFGGTGNAHFDMFVHGFQDGFDNILTSSDVFLSDAYCSGRFLPRICSRPFDGPTFELEAVWDAGNELARGFVDSLTVPLGD